MSLAAELRRHLWIASLARAAGLKRATRYHLEAALIVAGMFPGACQTGAPS